MRDLNTLNKWRDTAADIIAWYGSAGDHGNGVFRFRSLVDDRTLTVLASNGDGWDHVSVSKTAKPPIWREMEWIKRQFFEPHEVAMQLHVAISDHISIHPNCLHIWRPQQGEIPLPPAIMVG